MLSSHKRLLTAAVLITAGASTMLAFIAAGGTRLGEGVMHVEASGPGSSPSRRQESKPDGTAGGARAASHDARGESLKVELVTVRPDGFDPAEITRPRGRFYLVVDNLSELTALDLRLTRETGHSVHEVRVPRGQADWTGMLTLQPGTYVLREAAHPEWACRISVTP